MVAAAQVLHKRVTGGEDLRWPVPLQGAHRGGAGAVRPQQ